MQLNTSYIGRYARVGCVGVVCVTICVCVWGGGGGTSNMSADFDHNFVSYIFYSKTAFAFDNNKKYAPHVGRNLTNPLSLKADLSASYADYFNF